LRRKFPAARGRALVSAAALLAVLFGPGCATAPRREAPRPDAPFALRNPAVSLPAGALTPADAGRLDSGMDALLSGDVTAARKRFQAGAARSRVPAPFRLGTAYTDLVLSRYAAARALLEPLVGENADYVPAAEALADLDAAEGRLREALDRYRALLVLLPDDPRLTDREAAVRQALVEKGSAEAEAALAAKDLPAVRRVALSLVEIAPASPAGYRYLALGAQAAGKLEDAWAAASKAHALDPDDDAWSEATAALAMKTGRYAEAVGLYSDLVRREPGVAPSLEEARFQFQVQNLPEVARRAALSPRVTRAQFAVLAWWLVPEVREAGVVPSAEVAVDAVDRPESQALVRAIALGLFAVVPETHRVGADQPLSRAEAGALFRRIALLAGGGRPLPDCLGEEHPSPASLEKCGILPATTSRSVTGRETVLGLEAAALTGRGGGAR
jgi:tetratricopeptide (TPR) repeat protein